jgi:hypothetical protein
VDWWNALSLQQLSCDDLNGQGDVGKEVRSIIKWAFGLQRLQDTPKHGMAERVDAQYGSMYTDVDSEKQLKTHQIREI